MPDALTMAVNAIGQLASLYYEDAGGDRERAAALVLLGAHFGFAVEWETYGVALYVKARPDWTAAYNVNAGRWY